jgi:hypothetical protein
LGSVTIPEILDVVAVCDSTILVGVKRIKSATSEIVSLSKPLGRCLDAEVPGAPSSNENAEFFIKFSSFVSCVL